MQLVHLTLDEGGLGRFNYFMLDDNFVRENEWPEDGCSVLCDASVWRGAAIDIHSVVYSQSVDDDKK